MRATQVDGKGTVHLVASEMFADNVERGILANLPASIDATRADCPNHVPVVIGNAPPAASTLPGATREPG